VIFTAMLAVFCGTIVGFTLGLIGGGGSIMATPLLLYVVGMSDPHLAIGTGAVAVSANAFMNFVSHARAGTVRWVSAAIFAATGGLGALLGSTFGKEFNGQKLLILFALLMLVIGALMLRPRREGPALESRLTPALVARTGGVGFGVGLLSGFFGIGGGFLIVPGLILATGMPMINAVGTSLFAVGALGLATALNYAASGLVNWAVAGEYIAGGLFGGLLGMRSALHLAQQRQTLTRIFAAIIFIVAFYMLWRSLHG